jgi:hypothetical protein
MMTLHQETFAGVHEVLRTALISAPPVKTERWQGVTANTNTREIRNVNFEIDLECPDSMDVRTWQMEIKPNLPWADDHFLERVGGEPLNPGVQWAKWPYGNSANKFRTQGRFNHSYMERMWPKYARRTDDGKLLGELPGHIRKYPSADPRPKFGIGYHYGDLQDWVELLAKEPHTRQAWLPLFFPEDTGYGDGGRKMCSLGYQIMVRDDRAHIWYPLRSCDFVRHWADDCYLAVRMLLWVIMKCRGLNSKLWSGIVPGTYAMHMTSLHIFESDIEDLSKEIT